MLDPDFILFAVTEKHSQIEVADQAAAERLHREADLLLRRIEQQEKECVIRVDTAGNL